jgi:hypothetical protein
MGQATDTVQKLLSRLRRVGENNLMLKLLSLLLATLIFFAVSPKARQGATGKAGKTSKAPSRR